MEKQIKSTEAETLMTYQIAFDLYENASQQFLLGVRNALKALAPLPLSDPEQQGDHVKKEPDTTVVKTERYGIQVYENKFQIA